MDAKVFLTLLTLLSVILVGPWLGVPTTARADEDGMADTTVILADPDDPYHNPLGLVGTFLLVGSGAFLFLNARSWRGKMVAVLVATLGALAPAVLLLSALSVTNAVLLGPRVGAGLWNLAPGWQALITFAFEFALFGLVFALLRRLLNEREVTHI